jgi:hypothetical protein
LREVIVFEIVCTEFAAWWTTVTPAFAFLLALPFVVGTAGVIGDALRRQEST